MVASNRFRRAKSKRRRSSEYAIRRKHWFHLNKLRVQLMNVRHELSAAQLAERAAREQAEADRAAVWHLMRPRLTTELRALLDRQADLLLAVRYRQPHSMDVPRPPYTPSDVWAVMRSRVASPVLTEIDEQDPFVVQVQASLSGTPFGSVDMVRRIHAEVDRLGRMLAECILRKMTETPSVVAGLGTIAGKGSPRG